MKLVWSKYIEVPRIKRPRRNIGHSVKFYDIASVYQEVRSLSLSLSLYESFSIIEEKRYYHLYEHLQIYSNSSRLISFYFLRILNYSSNSFPIKFSLYFILFVPFFDKIYFKPRVIFHELF